MKMCNGSFSQETIALLKAAYAEEQESASAMFATYTCAECGTSNLVAKNHGGLWHPESHYPPGKKKVNPSGKSGYYKR